jgi:hypothetical protein
MLLQKEINDLIKTEIEGLFLDKQCNFYKQYKGGFRILKPHIVGWNWIGIKVNQKEYYCHRLIGKYILGIDEDIFITFRNGDKTDIRPENLQGKFTRHYKTYTIEKALTKVKCETTKRYYETKSKGILNSEFEKQIAVLQKHYGNEKTMDILGDTYLLINKYAERNLIFDIQKDTSCTFKALLKQKERNKRKSKERSFSESLSERDEALSYDYG